MIDFFIPFHFVNRCINYKLIQSIHEAGIATVGFNSNGIACSILASQRPVRENILLPMSTLAFTGIEKQYTNPEKKRFDYGFKAGAIVRTDYHKNEIFLNEIYAKHDTLFLIFWQVRGRFSAIRILPCQAVACSSPKCPTYAWKFQRELISSCAIYLWFPWTKGSMRTGLVYRQYLYTGHNASSQIQVRSVGWQTAGSCAVWFWSMWHSGEAPIRLPGLCLMDWKFRPHISG